MSASDTISVADLLVRRLGEHGVEDVFGYPGGQLTPVYDALYRQGVIRHRLARHEQAAGFMADGYARATGRPGVCLAVCGPGVFNAATPLLTAYTDSIPVLLISGQVPTVGQGLRSGYYHENDQLRACGPLIKWGARVSSPDQLVSCLDEAWVQLTTGRPGPVLLEIPLDVLRKDAPAAVLPPPVPPLAPPADPAEIHQLVDLIQTWERPLLLIGGGVLSAQAENLLRQLAERLGAPVLHTANGKGAFPASHPLAMGMPWVRATSDLTEMTTHLSPLLAQSDGLLALGCRFSQLGTASWSLRPPPCLVQIDIDPEEIGRHYPVQLGITADLGMALESLLSALPPTDRSPWASKQAIGQPWRLPGMDVVEPLRQTLPEDGILAADVTRLAYILMADFPLDHPRTFLHPSGAVAMGYAIPAALGARVAWPGRKVVAVVGDGGLLMSGMELATSQQEKLPIVVLLINDQCLSLIKSTQQRRYQKRYIAVDLENPDFSLLARAFGVGYACPKSDEELERALREAFDRDETTLIEVSIDPVGK
jgi:thiamine pyrophosphate-dependent acetolactate synthase large subunit-like protein